jgi:bifunctional non-homologous end joining protein LigD
MLLSSGAPPKAAVVVEPKWDGARSLVTVHDGRVTIHSRRGHDVTDCYPELLTLAPQLAKRSAVIDTEIVAFDAEGRCNFQRMQQRMNVHRPSARAVADVPVVLVGFDLLWLDGEDLTGHPLSARRERLESLGMSGHWQLTTRLADRLDVDLQDACASIGIEGLVVKADGPYRPGTRSRDWVKVKFRRTIVAVIGGQLTEKSRYGSLAVGVFHGGAFRYLGQVGNSLTRAHADQLERFLTTIEEAHSPFTDLVDPPMTFVDPVVAVEIEYTEVTAAGTLRQPVLVRVRPDVMAHTVTPPPDIASALDRRGRVRVAAGQRL